MVISTLVFSIASAGIVKMSSESTFAEHQETVKGSIEPGKLADLVVLSDDIFTIPPEAIEKTRVDMTIFDGKVIYQR